MEHWLPFLVTLHVIMSQSCPVCRLNLSSRAELQPPRQESIMGVVRQVSKIWMKGETI